MKKLLFVALLLVSLASCTENGRVRAWGGTGTINLEQGKKLVHVTWKDADLWYLTREMTPADVAETYRFSESSQFGVLEGTYIIVETK